MTAREVAGKLRAAAEKVLSQKKQRGEEDQEGDQAAKHPVAGDGQERAADKAAGDADRNEAPEPRPNGRQMFSIAENASKGANHEGESAGSIGDDGRRAKGKQGGKGDESAAAGKGIDGAAGRRCSEQANQLGGRHRRAG